MDLWVKKDVLENIKQKAISEHTTAKERKAIVDIMKSHGMPAIVALSEILKYPLGIDDTQCITKTMNQIIAEKD
jgi:hypothetical protein